MTAFIKLTPDQSHSKGVEILVADQKCGFYRILELKEGVDPNGTYHENLSLLMKNKEEIEK